MSTSADTSAALRRSRNTGTDSVLRLRRFLLTAVALWLALAGTAAAQTYATDTGSLTLGQSTTSPGGSVGVQGSGFQAGSDVQIVLIDGGDENVLATVMADDEGVINTTATLPTSFSGTGVIEARGISPDGASLVLSSPISSAAQSTSGSLARTGSSTIPWLVGGGIAAGVGVLLIALARQRRSATAAAG